VIERAFGANHSNVFEFSSTSPANSPGQSQSDHAANIRQRKALLEGYIEQLQLFGPTEPSVAVSVETGKFDNKQAVADAHQDAGFVCDLAVCHVNRLVVARSGGLLPESGAHVV